MVKSVSKSGGKIVLQIALSYDRFLTLARYRNFLLFIPADAKSLRAVLSYYSATASVNQEGDVHINDSLQGLGIYALFISPLFVMKHTGNMSSADISVQAICNRFFHICKTGMATILSPHINICGYERFSTTL